MPLFLPLVRFREEQNFRNPGLCSISYFVIKRRSANHSWRPSSKAARKSDHLLKKAVLKFLPSFLPVLWWIKPRNPIGTLVLPQGQIQGQNVIIINRWHWFDAYSDRIHPSGILNWRTIGVFQKHIVFHRCFFHLWDFLKNETSKTLGCAACLRSRVQPRIQISAQLSELCSSYKV